VLRFATVTLDTAKNGTAVAHSRAAYEANEEAFALAWGKEKFPDLADIFTKVSPIADMKLDANSWFSCSHRQKLKRRKCGKTSANLEPVLTAARWTIRHTTASEFSSSALTWVCRIDTRKHLDCTSNKIQTEAIDADG
jgi:hypothetical protein